MGLKDKIFDYIRTQHRVEPDYPWEGEDYAVFRHKDNKKWFALYMSVRRDRVGLEGDAEVDVVNLKIDDAVLHDQLIHEAGIVPAYHMNKRHWITVVLDGRVPEEQVLSLVDVSFSATSKKRKNS